MKKFYFNSYISLLLIDNTWMVKDTVRNIIFEIEPPGTLLIDIISALYTGPLTFGELLDALIALRQYPRLQLEAAFPALIEAGLLVEDDFVPQRIDLPWFEFWHQRDHIIHPNYSDSNVFMLDKEMMQDFSSEPLPELYKQYDTAEPIYLSHPAYGPPKSKIDALSHLVFFSFGRLREAIFLDFIPTMFKAVPSKGARHPFEAYILSNSAGLFEDGLYHYNVPSHRLTKIARFTQPYPEGVFLIVTVIFERYQWRYRDSWSYKDLYFELGHLRETIAQLAESLQLAAEEWMNLELLTEQYLSEEVVQVYRISGF